MNWELIVGLEIHAQLQTETKAFCRCANRYGDPPNTLTCPTCLGMPGALPVLSKRVVEQATKLALVLNATIHPRSKFDRKNYFYPDLPKGYQISQYDEPFSTGGYLDISGKFGTKRIRITRAHIEEDAGKSQHLEDGSTIVDMNRCGVPLVEIVTEPDFRSAEEAAAFVTTIRELLRYVEVCDGNMERGSLRCDVNTSIRPPEQKEFNERTEIKNLNSIRAVERAIQAERVRQYGIYASGGAIQRETLLWDEGEEIIRPMRRKEGSDDYRYFPEPDLVQLILTAEQIEVARKGLPELPWERRSRYREQLELHEEAVALLTIDRETGDYFDELLRLQVPARSAANWMQGEVRRAMLDRECSITEFPISPEALAQLIGFVERETVSLNQAKEVFRAMLTSGQRAEQIIQERGLALGGDSEDEIRRTIQTILESNPDELQRFRAGRKNLLGFFMGEAMKAAGKNANPKMLNKILQEMLNA